MKIRFLGTGSGRPNPERSTSSCLFEGENGGLLVDAGEGIAGVLRDPEIWTQEINSIIISHAHADHHCGLPMLLQGYKGDHRSDPLELIVNSVLEKNLLEWLDFLHLGKKYLPFDLILKNIEEKKFKTESGHSVEAWENDHFQNKTDDRGPSCSISIKNNSCKWIYSGDLNSSYPLKDKLPGSDGLICECTHIDVHEIHELAMNADVSKLIFTHFSPGFKAVDLDKTIWAYDNLIIQG